MRLPCSRDGAAISTYWTAKAWCQLLRLLWLLANARVRAHLISCMLVSTSYLISEERGRLCTGIRAWSRRSEEISITEGVKGA